MVSVHAYQVTIYFHWRGARREAEHARAPCKQNLTVLCQANYMCVTYE